MGTTPHCFVSIAPESVNNIIAKAFKNIMKKIQNVIITRNVKKKKKKEGGTNQNWNPPKKYKNNSAKGKKF